MYSITEEQRKQLLEYMINRPYKEVASYVSMLASLKKNIEEKKDDKSKKDMS
tara:strand:+ start:440 stop:595 length:156 start_codon:yes stop_codon:yes gene_type:complete